MCLGCVFPFPHDQFTANGAWNGGNAWWSQWSWGPSPEFPVLLKHQIQLWMKLLCSHLLGSTAGAWGGSPCHAHLPWACQLLCGSLWPNVVQFQTQLAKVPLTANPLTASSRILKKKKKRQQNKQSPAMVISLAHLLTPAQMLSS